jgi:hypothetical protein
MKPTFIFYWVARIGVAIILAQTLHFKFTGAEESVYIFSKVGMEPWGRIGVGVLELIAAFLLLINVTAWIGAALAAGLMGGAIIMHLTLIGIVVKNDRGQLFLYALIAFFCSGYILFVNRQKIIELVKGLAK